jgi:hypothetical protein
MPEYSNTILVRLNKYEYSNLLMLSSMLDRSLSDVVRNHLGLPPESESNDDRPVERHLRLVGGTR